MRLTTPIIVLSFLLFFSIPVSQAQRTFTPRVTNYSAEVEFQSLYESETQETGDRSRERNNIVFREQLNLALAGYMYHPRFVRFIASGSAGLAEKKYEIDQEGDWDTGSIERYELRAMVLPTHPYNLELFTIMYNQLLTGKVIDQKRGEVYQSGAHLRYMRKPWDAETSYIHQESKGGHSRKSDRYRTKAAYGRRGFSLSGVYQYLESSSTQRSDSENFLEFLNTISFGRVSLGSNWQLEKGESEDGGQIRREDENWTWSERLGFALPWNFSSAITYSQSQVETTRSGGDQPTEEKFRHSERVSFNLRHRLYNSLFSDFDTSYREDESSGGLERVARYAGHVKYHKKLYGGSRFETNLGGSLNQIDRVGAIVVLEESHSAPEPFNHFILNNLDIDAQTISILVKDPESGATAVLVENLHYLTFSTFDQYVEIQIINLPTSSFPGLIESYQYLVSYNLQQETAELTTRNIDFSTHLGLFKEQIVPYYSHIDIQTEIEEGSLSSLPEQTQIDTYGVQLRRDPFSAFASYQRKTSTASPSKTWSGGLSYRGYFLKDALLRAMLDYRRQLLLDLPSTASQAGEEKIQRTTKASIYVSKPLPKNIQWDFGNTFIYNEGYNDNTAYSVFSGFVWRVGKSEFRLETDFARQRTNNDGNISKNSNFSLYFKMKRKLL